MSQHAPILVLSEKLRRLYDEPSLEMTEYGTIAIDKHSQRFYLEGFYRKALVELCGVRFLTASALGIGLGP